MTNKNKINLIKKSTEEIEDEKIESEYEEELANWHDRIYDPAIYSVQNKDKTYVVR